MFAARTRTLRLCYATRLRKAVRSGRLPRISGTEPARACPGIAEPRSPDTGNHARHDARRDQSFDVRPIISDPKITIGATMYIAPNGLIQLCNTNVDTAACSISDIACEYT